MIRISTLDSTSYTFTDIPLKLNDGSTYTVTADYSARARVDEVFIRNDTASNRVFRMNNGAPFPVLAGEALVLTGVTRVDSMQVDTASQTGLVIFIR